MRKSFTFVLFCSRRTVTIFEVIFHLKATLRQIFQDTPYKRIHWNLIHVIPSPSTTLLYYVDRGRLDGRANAFVRGTRRARARGTHGPRTTSIIKVSTAVRLTIDTVTMQFARGRISIREQPGQNEREILHCYAVKRKPGGASSQWRWEMPLEVLTPWSYTDVNMTPPSSYNASRRCPNRNIILPEV